jgi:hypothetical protein
MPGFKKRPAMSRERWKMSRQFSEMPHRMSRKYKRDKRDTPLIRVSVVRYLSGVLSPLAVKERTGVPLAPATLAQ